MANLPPSPPLPPLRLIVGFSRGSASDDIAHLIAKPLGEQLQRAVRIERLAGDNGAHGALAVARSAPDGNTLFIATLGTHALAPHVRKDLPYDAQRDFEPVTLLTQSPMLLACHPSLPSQSVSEFVAHARARTGALALTYGTSAIGGAPHLAAELFQSQQSPRALKFNVIRMSVNCQDAEGSGLHDAGTSSGRGGVGKGARNITAVQWLAPGIKRFRMRILNRG